MKKLSLILVVLLAVACLLPALSESASLPNPVAAQSKDDFIGDWVLSGAAMKGQFLSAEALGATATLTVIDGTVTITFGEDVGVSTWELTEEGEMLFTDPDGSTGKLLLNDDGTLSIDYALDESNTLTMYFARAAEAEAEATTDSAA